MASLPEYEIIDFSQEDPVHSPKTRHLLPGKHPQSVSTHSTITKEIKILRSPGSERRRSTKHRLQESRPKSAQIPDRSHARSQTPDFYKELKRRKERSSPLRLEPVRGHHHHKDKRERSKSSDGRRESPRHHRPSREGLTPSPSKESDRYGQARSPKPARMHHKRRDDLPDSENLLLGDVGSPDRSKRKVDRSLSPAHLGHHMSRNSPSPSRLSDDGDTLSRPGSARSGKVKSNKKTMLKYMIHEVRELRKQLDPNAEASVVSRRSRGQRSPTPFSGELLEDSDGGPQCETTKIVQHHARQVMKDKSGDIIEEKEYTKTYKVRTEQCSPKRKSDKPFGSYGNLPPNGTSTPNVFLTAEKEDVFQPISPAIIPRTSAFQYVRCPVKIIVETDPEEMMKTIKE